VVSGDVEICKDFDETKGELEVAVYNPGDAKIIEVYVEGEKRAK